MRTLQNNFTTPEQSKRLLELGVPADSADCFYKEPYTTACILRNCDRFSYYCGDADRNVDYSKYTPCWSVGRLREIFCICSSVSANREYPFCNDQVVWWITEFEFKKEFINFSKLE